MRNENGQGKLVAFTTCSVCGRQRSKRRSELFLIGSAYKFFNYECGLFFFTLIYRIVDNAFFFFKLKTALVIRQIADRVLSPGFVGIVRISVCKYGIHFHRFHAYVGSEFNRMQIFSRTVHSPGS